MKRRTKAIALMYLITSSLECMSLPYKIYAEDNNGSELIQDEIIEETKINEVININETTNITDLENKIWIEEPGTKINNEDIKIRGWALNSSGVKEVKVYLDGKYIGNAESGIERLDVDKVYPGYPGGKNSGYEMVINKNEISTGKHELKVEAIGNDLSIRSTVKSIEMVKPENKLWIEEPGTKVNNEDIKVKGWTLNSSGVKEVKVYLDGKYIGSAGSGIERLDVDKAYPGYPGGKNSGYEMVINKNEISPGKHELKVEAIGNDLSIRSQVKSVEMVKPENKLWIEEPGTKVNNEDIKVKGWALNSSGVKEVKVYLDGKYIGSAEGGIER
jgi:hypothetical protein